MVDFLWWVQSLIKVGFALSVGPQHVPVMAICVHETVELQDESDKLGFTLEHLVEAEWGLILLLMGCSLHWKVRLLGTDVLDPFNKRFVNFNHATIFALHHFENFEFYEMFVAQTIVLFHFDQRLLLVIIICRIRWIKHIWWLIGCLVMPISIPMAAVWLLLITQVDRASSDDIKKLSKNGHQLRLRIHFLPLFAEHQDSFIRDQRRRPRNTTEQNIDALPALALWDLLKLKFHQNIRVYELICIIFFFAFFIVISIWQHLSQMLIFLFLIDIIHLLIRFRIFIELVVYHPDVVVLLYASGSYAGSFILCRFRKRWNDSSFGRWCRLHLLIFKLL